MQGNTSRTPPAGATARGAKAEPYEGNAISERIVDLARSTVEERMIDPALPEPSVRSVQG
jgi:hypothetical protein